MLQNEPCILVVDDEAAVRNSMAAYLEDLGYRVVAAASGREGMEALHRDHPAIVLLDLRMPGMDGLEALAAIREASADTAVIVVSGKGMLADAIEAMRLGAWDYVTKPVANLATLGHAIRRAAERLHLIEENRRYREHLEDEVRDRTAQLDGANRAMTAKNAALQEVLASIESERRRIGQQVSENVDRVILPLLEALKCGAGVQQARIVSEIERSLAEIVSPFVDELSRKVSSLTPTELRVCALVRRGLAAKEVAAVEKLSPQTISAHRRNIRRKLGIAHQRVNLVTYLNGLFHGQTLVA
jgi:DNA-binding NarL/FixJ family response regulator